ncbi:DUF917 domain-containing protein [Porticoccus sp. GXU_MW_L64]
MTMNLTIDDLEDIGRGAAFLGTGGGGDPYIGRMLATTAIQEYGMPEVISCDDLADDATVLTIAMLGAPTVLVEKAACGDDVDLAIRKLEERLGKKADALMPIEIGGVNSMLPIMAAARLNLPLIDADGMGRAFPEIQMVTFGVYGISCTPLTVTDDHLNSLVVETSTAKRAEDLVRVSSIEMGCSVILSSYPMTGLQAKKYAVHGTMNLALEIGRAIRIGREQGNPVDVLLSYLRTTPYYNQCKVIFDGKIVDLKREIKSGFTVGVCKLQSLSGDEDEVQITFQNEHLVVERGEQVLAIVPDLICLVDRETCEPIPVEAMKYGQRVKVLGVSAAPIMRTPESLAVFGPHAFGLPHEFTPIEQL